MSETGACVRCGETTDVRLGPVFICQACYEVRSSCCPEFGPDDLAKELYEQKAEHPHEPDKPKS